MDEEQLAQGLRRREPEAVQELVATHGDHLFRSAWLLCGNEADAQDLVQETLLQAIRSADRFRGRSRLYTWLHGILLNLTRHYRREHQRIVYDEDLARRETPASEQGPSSLDIAAASGALTQALQRLSLAHREVLVLRFYEDMKLHEIATHLGVSKGTVKSRLHYAIAELQKRMPGELNLFGAGDTQEKAQR
ncbi:MAG TPA: RNA polymerase sigma factor [Candidatus Acidoferrum sp.]|nr:RNA polymerase sigma factor [Candidatus Acidoferrum sp.]